MKALIPLSLLIACSPLNAEDKPLAERERLSGDWQGLRAALEDSGTSFFAYYTGIYANNVSGGIDTDDSYSGGLFFGTNIDLEKKFGWENMTFSLSGIDRHGRSIDRSVGGQYSVMQNVGGQNTFLYNVTLEKTFLEDDLALKFGRMSATDDFVGSPLYSFAMNNAVNGQIRAALFDGVMTSYPFAVWGARLQYQPTDNLYAKVGLFQLTDTMWDPTLHGLDFDIDSDDGLSLFTQIGWTSALAGRQTNVFVGANQVHFDMERFDGNGFREDFTRLYAHADIKLYSESNAPDNGLTAFLTYGYTSHDDVAIVPIQSTLGFNYKGLFASRDQDATLLYLTYGGFSDAYSENEVIEGRSAKDYEMVLELAHRFQLSPASYIQPDLQYIMKPGGTGNVDDALVLGFQFGASF